MLVRGAIEQALAGGNAAAQVSAVKLLSDLDVYGRDTCSVCEKTAAVDMPAVRQKLETLIEAKIRTGVEARTRELEEQLRAVRAEHSLA